VICESYTAAGEPQKARYWTDKSGSLSCGCQGNAREREATGKKKELVRQKMGGEEQWQWQI
jgi:hypothetical protein